MIDRSPVASSGSLPHRRVTLKHLPGKNPAAGRPSPPAPIVFCVPAAGTGARGFLARFAHSPLRDRLRVVQLPGREDRFNEPCMDDIRQMGEAVAVAVIDEQPVDYALFGHSFGSVVILEAARCLEQLQAALPALVAVAACAAPHVPSTARFDEMEPLEIAGAVQGLGGLDLSGPGGEALAAHVLPSLSADFYAFAKYLEAPWTGPISSPILAMFGASDSAADRSRVESWRSYTRGEFEVREYQGGHFFPLESDLPLRHVLDLFPVSADGTATPSTPDTATSQNQETRKAPMRQEPDLDSYDVVINHEEQYSIWPHGRDLPDGWRLGGLTGSRSACLEHIETVWTDMRPLSLRREMDQSQADQTEP